MAKNNIRSSIIDWNNRFPLDKWWRKKYKIPYLSEEHRESTFFSQYFEYHEDEVFEEYYEEQAKIKDAVEIPYMPLSGNWWKSREISKEEADDWFKSPLM